MKKQLILNLLILLISSSVFATNEWTHFGTRQLGMGNAFVGIADDQFSLFYNPAGLARMKTWKLGFLDFNLEVSKNTVDFTSDLMELASGEADTSTAALDVIRNQSGENHHGSLKVFPHFYMKNFGFGLAGNANLDMVFNRYPSIYVGSLQRLYLPVSFAMSFLDDRLSVGVTGKMKIVTGIDQEFSAQIIDTLAKDNQEGGTKLEDYVVGGMGYGLDVGMLLTPIEKWKPTLGLSLVDVGGTSYEKFTLGQETFGTPSVDQPSLQAGISLTPVESTWHKVLLAADMHRINQKDAFSKKVHFGMEYTFYDMISLQTGTNHGYLSGGVGINMLLFELKFATYSVERGEVAGQKEDRRYLIQTRWII